MIDRRQFLGTSLAAVTSGLTANALPQAAKPNVVFILADDLGYGDLGCYGQQRIRTPNIDALAAGGLRFTQAYAGSTVCAPSRCALMTGYHTGHCRVRGNARVPLRDGDFTVADLFRQAGYRTALMGKWGLGDPGSSGLPNARGFDEFYGYLDQTHAHEYYPAHIWSNQQELNVPQNMGTSRKFYLPDEITKRSLDFIERNRAQPFFLYLATILPHANNELGRDTGNGMSVPSLGSYAQESWPEVERGFAAMVSRLDDYVGQVVRKIKDLGLEDRTLVIFTSDNGPHHEGGHDAEFFRSSGPLRGTKRALHEGGVRVPMIARMPGRVPAGRTTDAVVAFWDFLPTAAALTGVSAPAGLDGRSFLPLLEGGRQANRPPLYWEFHEGGFFQAVRSGDWKLVGKELYNLKDDPGEKNNLAAKEPARVAELTKLFTSERTDSPDFPVKK